MGIFLVQIGYIIIGNAKEMPIR